MRAAPVNDEGEVAAARSRAGERSVGQRRRLIGQRRALALSSLLEQVGGGQRTDFLVAIDHDLIAEAIGGGAALDRFSAASITAMPPFMSATPGP